MVDEEFYPEKSVDFSATCEGIRGRVTQGRLAFSVFPDADDRKRLVTGAKM